MLIYRPVAQCRTKQDRLRQLEFCLKKQRQNDRYVKQANAKITAVSGKKNIPGNDSGRAIMLRQPKGRNDRSLLIQHTFLSSEYSNARQTPNIPLPPYASFLNEYTREEAVPDTTREAGSPMSRRKKRAENRARARSILERSRSRMKQHASGGCGRIANLMELQRLLTGI